MNNRQRARLIHIKQRPGAWVQPEVNPVPDGIREWQSGVRAAFAQAEIGPRSHIVRLIDRRREVQAINPAAQVEHHENFVDAAGLAVNQSPDARHTAGGIGRRQTRTNNELASCKGHTWLLFCSRLIATRNPATRTGVPRSG